MLSAFTPSGPSSPWSKTTHDVLSFLSPDVFQATTTAVDVGPAAASFGDTDSLLTPAIDEFIRQTLASWGVNGASVAVVRRRTDGSGEFDVATRGYGRAARDGRPVTADTVIPIGSNSKAFVASSVGLLVTNESMPLEWTTKVHDVLPEFELQDDVATRRASIIDIFSHRTGLPRHDVAFRSGALDEGAPGDFSLHAVKHLKMSAEFRETGQYNNHMYNIGASLVSHLSGMPFTDFVSKHIFDAAGFSNRTRYVPTDSTDHGGGLAEGFFRMGENNTDGGVSHAVYPTGVLAALAPGAGGVMSTANDVALWLQVLLKCGFSPATKRQVIPCDVLQQMEQGKIALVPSVPPELSPVVYGMGFMSGSYQGQQYIDHGGAVIGYMSQIVRFPNSGLGIAVLVNDSPRGQFVHEAIRWRIAEEILGLPLHVDWTTRYRLAHQAALQAAAEIIEGFQPSPPGAPLPSAGLDALVGDYAHPAYGTLRLRSASKNGTVLEATGLGWAEGLGNTLRLTHYAGDVFNATVDVALRTLDGYTAREDSLGVVAEFDRSATGVGLRGAWGAGTGVPDPVGPTPQDRSEVWFTRVEAHEYLRGDSSTDLNIQW